MVVPPLPRPYDPHLASAASMLQGPLTSAVPRFVGCTSFDPYLATAGVFDNNVGDCYGRKQSMGSLRPSLAERLRMEVAKDMITLAARTSDTAFEENAPQFSSIPAVPFRLPDGTEVKDVTGSCCRCVGRDPWGRGRGH